MKKIHLPAGTEHVQFGELVQLIANALRPLDDDATDSEMMAHGGTRINLEAELNQAVKDGTLPVKDPLTFGPHTFPVGDALRRSMVTVGDLSAFLAGRPVALEIAPEQAATPEAATAADLMTYRAREQFTLFELACLLHRADPEKMHNDTWDGWREHKRQLGLHRPEVTPALFIDELSLMPERIAGPLIGGTIKQLKKAIGCATILHSIEANQARALSDSLGLSIPPELSAAQAQQAPEPQAAPVVAESASGGDATVNAGQRKSGSNMRDLVLPYMRRVYKAGQYSTAKELFRALEKKAGIDDSPFEQGTGLQVGSLFVRELGKPLSLKTVQNHYWKELRDTR